MSDKDLKAKNNLLGKFTQKEIYDIPSCLKNVLEQKVLINNIAKEIVNRDTKHIYLLGAGSSYHAGYAMSYMFNRITAIPTFPEFSMEFQYLIKPILSKEDYIIGISQSGATRDTIESIEISKEYDCLTIGITNNLNSKLAKISDYSVGLKCDEEKSVLATKTYVAELTVLAMLSLEIAKHKKSISNEEYNEIWVELIRIPDRINSELPNLHKKVKKYSKFFKFTDFCFILGSGPDYATAMEAALKLKEGARIYGQAYPTAEFPHGPITLVDPKTLIMAIIPQEGDRRKKNLLNLLKRIKERKATILGIYEPMDEDIILDNIHYGIQVPNTFNNLQPLIMIVVFQLLSLEIARMNGLNPDEPKYLTKVSNL